MDACVRVGMRACELFPPRAIFFSLPASAAAIGSSGSQRVVSGPGLLSKLRLLPYLYTPNTLSFSLDLGFHLRLNLDGLG